MALNSGEPLAGGVVSGGTARFFVNVSRTYQAIPPHRPALASPTPTQRGSMNPSLTVGPGGKLFEKWSPQVLGWKPATAFALMAESYAGAIWAASLDRS